MKYQEFTSHMRDRLGPDFRMLHQSDVRHVYRTLKKLNALDRLDVAVRVLQEDLDAMRGDA